MVDKFLELLITPRKLKSDRLTRFNIVSILLIVLLSAISLISFVFYRLTLFEIQGIFFASGAISDIMQTTEIAYAHTYRLRSQLMTGNYSEFESDMTSAIYLKNYVFGYNVDNFKHLASDVT